MPDCNLSFKLDGPDPTHQHDDGTWWWYDETWAYEHGPYPSESAANIALKKYCEESL